MCDPTDEHTFISRSRTRVDFATLKIVKPVFFKFPIYTSMTSLKLPAPATHLRFRTAVLLAAVAFISLIAVACGGDTPESAPFDPQSSPLGVIEISSLAFADGEQIPVKFTCDGAGISPPLRWSDPPAGTRALAIIVDDPYAPRRIFRHWSIFNIPSETRSFKEALADSPQLENTIRQGLNDFGKFGYGGPCPPAGQEHEYVFFIYALSEQLELPVDADPDAVAAAIRGLVLGTGSFSGMYARQ